jgi:hypothetical protein
MILAFTKRNAFVSFLAVVLSFSALVLIIPLPSFADRIVSIHQYTTLAIGCDLNSDDYLIYPTKALTYDQPTKLT